MMKTPDELLEQQEGLWRNCGDSISHALEHLSSLNQEKDPWHNYKWAILSVAHAAEVYCNLLLCLFDPNHPDNPRGYYPALDKARELLRNHPLLSDSERLVIEKVLAPLSDQRNRLMHMPAPETLTATDTAIALLSLLHIIRRRTGVRSLEFFDEDTTVERDVFEQIEWRKYDQWYRVAEELVKEEYGAYVETCENCGTLAVTPDSSECRACFEPANRS
jgi:hypothetical protein